MEARRTSLRLHLPASLLAALFALGAGAARAQLPERLVERIHQVALTQEELPPGWTLLGDRVDDPLHFKEVSTLTSLVSTLPGASAINLGHAVQTRNGVFNIEYFAFQDPEGAAKVEPHFKATAKEHGWLTFRMGDLIVLAATDDPQVHQLLGQARLVPFLNQLLEESLAAEKRGEVAAAEQGYYALVQTAPIYARAWLRLGVIYQAARPPKVAAALNAYKEAVEAHQKSPSLTDDELWQAYVGWGMTNLFKGNKEQAYSILEDALRLAQKLGPDKEARSYYFLASAYVPYNDLPGFVEKLEAAFEIEQKLGKSDLVEQAQDNPAFEPFQDKKKFKKLLKKYGGKD